MRRIFFCLGIREDLLMMMRIMGRICSRFYRNISSWLFTFISERRRQWRRIVFPRWSATVWFGLLNMKSSGYFFLSIAVVFTQKQGISQFFSRKRSSIPCCWERSQSNKEKWLNTRKRSCIKMQTEGHRVRYVGDEKPRFRGIRQESVGHFGPERGRHFCDAFDRRCFDHIVSATSVVLIWEFLLVGFVSRSIFVSAGRGEYLS